MQKINVGKNKIFWKKAPEWLARRSFLVFIFLSILSAIASGIVFYSYGYSLKNFDPKSTDQKMQLNETGYQSILNFWSERKENFDAADSKIFKDPFR